jgi:4-aminobutyrate aminotransferase-like enzyme
MSKMKSNENDLMERANEYLIPVPSNPPFIVRGDGVTVEDIDGRNYLDFTAGPGVLSVGHCHPEIVEVARTQIGTLTQCPGNVLNVQYIDLAIKLAQITPGNLKRSFFCNSGAEAVDGAVKLAKRYAVKNCKAALGVVALEHGFHGRLALPLSLTGMTNRKKGLSTYCSFPGVHHIMAPYCYRCPLSYPSCEIFCAAALENLFKTQTPADDIAAFICEPVMGVGGVIVPPKEYLPRIEEICRKNGVLLIFDEIFSGFGRTGKMFASEHFGVTPDIMTVGKAVGGGLPLGGLIATEEVGNAFDPGDHYTTYGPNNVMALATGLKGIEILERENLADHAARVGEYFLSKLLEIQAQNEFIGDVRGKGLFIGVEIVTDKTSKKPGPALSKTIKDGLKEKGILASVTGVNLCVLRMTPPLTINNGHVDHFVTALEETLRSL